MTTQRMSLHAEGVLAHWQAQSLRIWDAIFASRRRRLALGLVVGALLPFLSEIIADFLDRRLDVHAPNMVFLCAVIFAAIGFGRIVGITSALCAFLVYNFYLTEPRGMIGFAGLEDVLTLLVFVGVALVTGTMAGNLHDERDLARAQVGIFASLLRASRPLAQCHDPEEALRLLEAGARQMATRQALVFTNATAETPISRAPAAAPPMIADAAARMLSTQFPAEAYVEGWRLQVVHAAEKNVAVLAWLPQKTVAFDQLAIAMRLLSEMTGIAIERALYIRRQLELDSLAAADKLRTALMSSISHDFRTPLSTILTSSTSLITYGDQFPPATHLDLLTSIQEEAERLNRFVNNIMDMTRLDAGVIKPRGEWTDPLEVLDNLQERMRRRLGERALTVSAPAAVPSIHVDPVLLEQALVNVVENALVHAPSSDITIGAAYCDSEVSLWVEDDGPGAPETALASIFDKFHRLNPSDSGGAGLGLAISKGFVEAMHGKVVAISPARDGRGLKVQFTFARAEETLT
jgi:two-component system sensor histidine kinase KdpD